MKEMGFPRLSVVQRHAQRVVELGFNHLFTYMYVEQLEIDRSVAHHRERDSEPLRKGMFRFLFGLTNSTQADLEARRLEARVERKRVADEASLLRSVLLQAGYQSAFATEAAADDLRKTIALLESQAEALSSEGRPRSGKLSMLQQALSLTESEWQEADELCVSLDRAIAAREAQIGSLELELGRLQRVADASQFFALLEFQSCPRCAQELLEQQDTGTCRLCRQPEPVPLVATSGEPDLLTDLQPSPHPSLTPDIERMLAEMRGVQQRDQADRTALGDRRDALRDRTAEYSGRIKVLLEDFIGDRLESYSDVRAQLAAGRERLIHLESDLLNWDRVADSEQRAQSLIVEIRRLDQSIAFGADSLAGDRANVMTSLSERFAEILAEAQIRGVTSAEISSENYLPYVNGIRFDAFTVGGGTRTAIVVAYWLSLISVALSVRDTLLPAFLIIDNPRKAIGPSEAMAENLYRTLDNIAHTTQFRGRDMQVIVADNYVPEDVAANWQLLVFDFEHPTVASVAHPGEDQVTTVEGLASSAAARTRRRRARGD